ncbi:MAG: ADP-ribosylglycohydrolase family protein [Desulfovibrionaceae bacterium]|nr:ADP-ribosylglycohydrolase family protein [Desulfovibrionaceae bacterium]
MYGAIIGDLAGSQYERHNYLSTDFPLLDERSFFTDDTVLTVATAEAMLTDQDFAAAYRKWAGKYPGRGYGPMFRLWVGNPDMGPYGSPGNGAAMRVSPIPFLMRGGGVWDMIVMAGSSAKVTHNSKEGEDCAAYLAMTIWFYLHGEDGLGLWRPLEPVSELRGKVRGCRAKDTVRAAMSAVNEATGFEQAVRLAVSIGGDSDTIASMAGAVAEAKWGAPEDLKARVKEYLPDELIELIEIADKNFQQGVRLCQWAGSADRTNRARSGVGRSSSRSGRTAPS